MERVLTTVNIPAELYLWLKKITKELYNTNTQKFVQTAYDYVLEMCKDDIHALDKDIERLLGKYAGLFIMNTPRKTVHIKVEKIARNYNISKLITLYVLVYADHYKNAIGEEFISNVHI